MGYRYGILGAGRQGTAAAYDLAQFGDADSIILADKDISVALRSAERVNALCGSRRATVREVNVRRASDVREFMIGLDVCLSAVPYYLNLSLARQAIRARCSMCDLGGNTQVVLDELALEEPACKAGITIIPDCGLGPGMMSNLTVYAMEQLDRASEAIIYDGGLPQNPRPPLNYRLFFNIEGLVNEYLGEALYLENGQVTRVKTFDDRYYETLDVPELGTLEAFVTSGGLSTLVKTYEGKLQTLQNKTLRYPGHVHILRELASLHLIDLAPGEGLEAQAKARRAMRRLLEPAILPEPDDRDLVVVHIITRGEKGGKPATVTLDLLDRYDEPTGFSAMERTTGFHLAMVAEMIARGETPTGAVPLEKAVSAGRIVEQMERRGMHLNLTTRLDE